MTSWILVALVLAWGFSVIATFWVPRRRPEPATSEHSPEEYTTAVARHLRRTRLIAWPAALVTGLVAAAASSSTGAVLVLAPALAMLGVVGSFAIGEMTAPVPARTASRSASLEPRIPMKYLTGVQRLLFITAQLAALAVAAVGLMMADETGRGIAVTCSAGSQHVAPFPGIDFGVAGLWALLPVQLVGAGAFQLITNRPATVLTAAAPADRMLRAATARAVTRATIAACLMIICGVGGMAGIALRQLADGPCPAGWRPALGTALIALGVVAGAVLVAVVTDALRMVRAHPVHRATIDQP